MQSRHRDDKSNGQAAASARPLRDDAARPTAIDQPPFANMTLATTHSVGKRETESANPALKSSSVRTRVIFLSISFDPEPGAMMGLPLARRLRDFGYDVRVLTAIPWYPLGRRYPGYRWRLWQWENMDGIRVLRVPLYPSHDRSAVRRIMTYLSFMMSAIVLGIPRIGPADIVFYFDSLPTTGAIAYALRLFRGARTVQHIGDMWPDTVTESGMLPSPLRPLASRVVGGWCRFLYRRHAAITVASPGLKQLLHDRGVPPDKVSVVYNWAYEDRFFPAVADPSIVRELDAQGKLTVLYAGNLGALQSLDTVVDAARLLRDRPDIQLLIMGTGAMETSLRDRARGLDNVRFFPARPVEQMNAVNAACDALLVHLKNVPLMHRTTPSKTQVALACGKPLLVGVAGDAARLTERSGAGFAFAPEDPQAMADAIRRMADLTPEARRSMGVRAREFYDEQMSLDIGSRTMASVFAAASA